MRRRSEPGKVTPGSESCDHPESSPLRHKANIREGLRHSTRVVWRTRSKQRAPGLFEGLRNAMLHGTLPIAVLNALYSYEVFSSTFFQWKTKSGGITNRTRTRAVASILLLQSSCSSRPEGSVYTDPGSGIFLIQIIIVGALTFAYRFRKAIAGLFGSRRNQNPSCEN